MKPRHRSVFLLALAAVGGVLQAETFSFKDEKGQFLDVLADGKPLARYMYSSDVSTPAKRNDNYKPYLHVFDAEGKEPITKGPGGEFPHHRGIFLGWNKLTVAGTVYDRWHMKGGEQVHKKFLAQSANASGASFTSLVEWTGGGAAPVLVEERTVRFLPAPKPAYALLEMESRLKAVGGETVLDGDPEHAGLQFRPAAEVARPETLYVFAKANADAHKDRDFPWVGETFTLRGERFSVVYFNHPANPPAAIFSAYRDYGRFGAWFKDTIPANGERTIKVRFLVSKGEMQPAEFIQKLANDFTGLQAPVPALTLKKSDQPKPAAPTAAAAPAPVPVK